MAKYELKCAAGGGGSARSTATTAAASIARENRRADQNRICLQILFSSSKRAKPKYVVQYGRRTDLGARRPLPARYCDRRTKESQFFSIRFLPKRKQKHRELITKTVHGARPRDDGIDRHDKSPLVWKIASWHMAKYSPRSRRNCNDATVCRADYNRQNRKTNISLKLS